MLDNFETNLKPRSELGADPTNPAWACQDPAWDRCLQALASGLVGASSRILITSRRPLAALTQDEAMSVRLGPMLAAEAAL